MTKTPTPTRTPTPTDTPVNLSYFDTTITNNATTQSSCVGTNTVNINGIAGSIFKYRCNLNNGWSQDISTMQIWVDSGAGYTQVAVVGFAYRSNYNPTGFRSLFSFQLAAGQPVYYQNFKFSGVGAPPSVWYFPRDNLT